MKTFTLFIISLFVVAALPAQNKTVVVITAGQSNADGRVPRADLPSSYKYKNCLWSYNSGVNTTNGKFSVFSPKTYQTNKTDCWAFDATTYYKIDSTLSEPFSVIKETVGGTAIDPSSTSKYNFYWSADATWLDSNKSTIAGGYSLLKALTQSIDSCIKNTLDTIKAGYEFKAILWHQGESDQTSTAAISKYYSNLKDVVDYIRCYLCEKTGNSSYMSMPFICGTISRHSSSYDSTINKAFYDIAKEDANFYVVDMSTAALQSDSLHFTAPSAEYLGTRMYEKMCEIKALPTAINDVTAKPSADDAAYYNIQGMKVTAPSRGLYIHNGRKIVFR